MFKEAIRLTSAAILLAMAASCSGNGEKEKAEALLGEAREAVTAGRYERALELTDSLKRAYPGEIDCRREALHVAANATEGLTQKRLESADSTLAVLGVKGDSLRRLIKYVDNPIEGYYAGVKANPSAFVGTTGIQARVSPAGDFYIISSLPASRGVRSTSVTVSSDGASASTATVPHDGERNDRSMGTEVITFLGAECDEAGRFILDHRDSPMTLTFNGAKSYSVPLPPAQADETATLYEYSVTLREAKVAAIEKERLSRAREIARSQAARTFVEKDTIQR